MNETLTPKEFRVEGEAIEEAWWEDLMPECLFKLRVRGLASRTVAMDAHGRNLYAEAHGEARRRLPDIRARLGTNASRREGQWRASGLTS